MTSLEKSPPRALTIAGSDCGGCAGIQADLKTFAALGVHGMSVVTAVTAQDTRRVYLSSDIPLDNIHRQMDAVLEDIGVDAVKTGMLPSVEIIRLVAKKVKQFNIKSLVVDPIMVSTGGDRLVPDDALEVMKTELFPLATVITPNLQEAEFLIHRKINGQQDLQEAVQEIFGLGSQSVIVKGGHLDDPEQSTDYFYDGETLESLMSPRLDSRNTHGSGCTFASAITAYLARGLDLGDSTRRAKEYVTEAIRHSLSLGHGHGPLGHFWKFWKK
ncbi:MAG: bifunctional hydroxymethylpyrimidine kinase/phosphomethylpyrimidine kinase [Acidobacteriota bacterium]